MVASYTQLLAQRYEGKLHDKGDKFIAYAVEGVTRMQRLLSDLLEYSRVGTEPKPFMLIESSEILSVALSNIDVCRA